MCRHLGWLGEPRSLAALVLDPPYGLLVQAYAPRRQKHGVVNADGWGVGFIADGPRRWRSASPLWADASFASVAPVLTSRCVVAAVRSATVGMPIEASASAPFTDGEWLLSHNGRVDRDVLPPAPHAESVVDSARLAALIFERGLDALAQTIAEVGAADPNARLNILAGNGSRLLATTWGDTLSMLRCDDGVLLASEPSDDDPRWEDVPDRHLVDVTLPDVDLDVTAGRDLDGGPDRDPGRDLDGTTGRDLDGTAGRDLDGATGRPERMSVTLTPLKGS